MLARLGLEDPAVAQPEPRRRRTGQLRGAVGRVVVGQHDLDRPAGRRGSRCAPASATIASSSFQAAITIVTGGHSPSGHPPRGADRVGLVVARDQQGEDQKADDHAGDVGQQDRDHPRKHRPGGQLELVAPRLGRPHAERHPGQRQHERDGEANRRAQPRSAEDAAASAHQGACAADAPTPARRHLSRARRPPIGAATSCVLSRSTTRVRASKRTGRTSAITRMNDMS